MENGAPSSTEEGFLSRMAINDNKAGMEGLDRDRINKIIMESSKGSRFYENELKKEQQVNQRIEKMMLQKAQITEQQLKKAQSQVEKMTSKLEKSRDLSRAIVHVDMDAFYAAVEIRDCPELKDKPMAVGSMSMLSTSNYHARKYGVRAAMPGFIAKKLCPNLVIVPTNFDKYRAVSDEIREIFADYDPHFQPMSLDEAYLDFTDHLEQRQSWPESSRTHRYRASSLTADEKQPEDIQGTEADIEDLSPVLFEDSPSSSPCLPGSEGAAGAFEVFGTSVEEAVREMRFRVEQKTMLTASAGIAPNMMLAKVCSDKNKPNGHYRLPPTREAVMDFIQNLPVRKVCGIGKVSEKMLNALGITSCSHLGQQMALLSLLFSETAWHHFMEVSLGLGSTYIPRHEERKSMSTERTFRELSNAEEQLSLCRELCEDLAEDMQKESLKAKTVTLKIKNIKFEVKTRAQTLPYAVATVEEIFAVAKDLLKTEIENESPQPLRLRLMGVRMSAFVSVDDKTPMQKSIIGFLQPGKIDCSASPQIMHQIPEKDQLSSHTYQTSQPLHCLSVQIGQRGEGIIWPNKQKHIGGDQTGEEPRQSFFQRAHAKRLQLQTTNAPTGAEGCREKSSVTASIDRHPKEDVLSATKTKTNDCTAPDLSENESVSPVQAHASTSGYGTHPKSLTCPVCSRQVETTDLNVFNMHIDQCLKDAGTTAKESKDSDEESNLDPENDRLESAVGHKRIGECEDDEEQSINSEGLASSRSFLQEGQQSLKKDSVQKVLLNKGDKEPVTPVKSQSRQGKSPALVCPVCQLTQDTEDLTVFNHHVDLCLNQDVLHELGGQTTFSINPSAVKNNKTTERGHYLPKAKGKSKRRDSPSSPPPKKAKGRGFCNTIDKFFR
ncbi:DNA polymerase kappa [Cololabis saira]|uniref:DNA polymerase kappa n=1 Tax=Cololabis saira TaxID=129043 RepID=UPI002AD33DA0|nr:DNA polymerase kappa [Cololabis saira]